jgi:hypothetical protein
MSMPLRLADFIVRLVLAVGVTGLMLVPTGMCVCAHAEDESPVEQHEPGCPKVRKLDRPAAPEHYAGDPAPAAAVDLADDACPAGPVRPVVAVGHGPPRGRPIYLALQTLLI